MIGQILVAFGIIMIFNGIISFSPKKGETMLIPFLSIGLGVFYIFLGVPFIADPPWGEVIQDVFYILAAGTFTWSVAKWTIKRTALYISFKKAIDSIPKIEESLKNIENLLIKEGGKNEEK